MLKFAISMSLKIVTVVMDMCIRAKGKYARIWDNVSARWLQKLKAKEATNIHIAFVYVIFMLNDI